jgi:hypothetical protein
MDDIVKAALAKWPNVPHCYGWLSLDARGTWRMHDERAQALNLKGDPIRHGSLNDFINRNYGCDENGCWFFQNGPQRVYVDLETAPYVAHFIPETNWFLHTKVALPNIDKVYLSSEGNLIFTNDDLIAIVDDRDLEYALRYLQKNQQELGEDDLLDWLQNTSSDFSKPFELTMRIQEKCIPVHRSELSTLLNNKNYQQNPRK